MMAKRILIMGLPGSGKTFLSKELKRLLEQTASVTWLNADEVREKYNDWDFSPTGRLRQSKRMHSLALLSKTEFVIIDMVAPLEEMRDNVDAHWTVWVDTIESGRYEDTNKMFVQPSNFDIRVTEQDAVKWARIVCNAVR